MAYSFHNAETFWSHSIDVPYTFTEPFNEDIGDSEFLWKVVKVVPIPKPNDQGNPSLNYPQSPNY